MRRIYCIYTYWTLSLLYTVFYLWAGRPLFLLLNIAMWIVQGGRVYLDKSQQKVCLFVNSFLSDDALVCVPLASAYLMFLFLYYAGLVPRTFFASLWSKRNHLRLTSFLPQPPSSHLPIPLQPHFASYPAPRFQLINPNNHLLSKFPETWPSQRTALS